MDGATVAERGKLGGERGYGDLGSDPPTRSSAQCDAPLEHAHSCCPFKVQTIVRLSRRQWLLSIDGRAVLVLGRECDSADANGNAASRLWQMMSSTA